MAAKNQLTEQAMQQAIVKFCKVKEANCRSLKALIHIPNGGQRPRAEAAIMKSLGVRAGVSDLFLPMRRTESNCNFIGLWIELKRPGGKPTKSQEEWMDLMRDMGHHACVKESVKEALTTIAWYLGQNWDYELSQITN
ncbi:MAG: VRR-NUC domain-containing protein [Hyphomicrobiaceae bacterium]|nr:MAG: VRR-NUC domain-containing protein [Hyphomicrobiaceae bacterium]